MKTTATILVKLDKKRTAILDALRGRMDRRNFTIELLEKALDSASAAATKKGRGPC